MTETIDVRIAFPGLDGPAAHEKAESLLRELRQDPALHPHLDRDRTAVARTDPQAMDFGATLIAVLGTPAIIILARAIKSWAERTGTTTIALDGVRIENVRSQDAAAIVAALEKRGGTANPSQG